MKNYLLKNVIFIKIAMIGDFASNTVFERDSDTFIIKFKMLLLKWEVLLMLLICLFISY